MAGDRDTSNPYLFEFAYEVANKVGGIYTVIRTKAEITVQEFGNRFFMVGPLNRKTAGIEVEEISISAGTKNPVEQAILELQSEGIVMLYGRWLIEGGPLVILFDLGSVYDRKIWEWKKDIWDRFRIPAPDSDSEMNDAILVGYLEAWLLELVSQKDKKTAILAHFHEWQVGVGIALIRDRKLDVATLFTTHATLLGRYLCAGDVDFYNNMGSFNVDEEAGRRGIYHRYCVERAAAHAADVFTTVSNITAYEAQHLLKRRADGIVPNGLNVVQFSAMHEFQNLHQKSKLKINEFVRGHFYGHMQNFDLENTVYFFTAGRYEYRNKGIDMYVEALGRLNERLAKSSGNKITVVAFIIAPAKCQSYTVETLKGQALIKQLRETVDDVSSHISATLFEGANRGEIITDLLTDSDKIMLKRRVLSLRRDSQPPIVTHNMLDDSNDPVLNQLRRLHLFNSSNDRVKVVFHPEFLNANNPVLGMDYDDFVRGTHLGVFPSYYEPWGYTPAECTVMGVPSITSNLSGFGCFMQDNIVCPEDYGIYIVDRRLKSVDESVNQLTDIMFEFVQKTRRQRINQRNRTERLSELLDWKRLGIEYMKARHLALRRKYPNSKTTNPLLTEDESESETNEKESGRKKMMSRPASAYGSPISSKHPSILFAKSPVDGDENEDDLRPPIHLKTPPHF
ncbi:Glycogen [starch] synthase [Zancudomyces culisetae]|uniref:Glycogen [starch] synthase n=1 Tax=Zancudomyces culisetae TaxID=1213189 RepID=A0A1R1PYE4_ZANCU|nr:Glycogen [starch] synthase [Zancudomyces culisetae]|eukprot:OMH85937.1 Glycogen [starch] synthase [Zancudomyces culisetae]